MDHGCCWYSWIGDCDVINVGFLVLLLITLYRHPGSFDIITVKDAINNTFATRKQNVFVIGTGTKPAISLPKGKGIKVSQSHSLE